MSFIVIPFILYTRSKFRLIHQKRRKLFLECRVWIVVLSAMVLCTGKPTVDATAYEDVRLCAVECVASVTECHTAIYRTKCKKKEEQRKKKTTKKTENGAWIL